MTNAVLAPRLGCAVLLDERQGTLLFASGTKVGQPARAAEVERIFSEPYLLIEDREQDEVIASLAEASAISQAIDLFASGLDRSLSDGARSAAIRAADSLLETAEAYTAVRRAGLSVPQTSNAWDLAGAVMLAYEAEANIALRIYKEIEDNLYRISAINDSLDRALARGGAPILKEVAIKCIRQSGLIADLLDDNRGALTSDRLKKSIVLALRAGAFPSEDLQEISSNIFSALESFTSGGEEATTLKIAVVANYLSKTTHEDEPAKGWLDPALYSASGLSELGREVTTALVCDSALLGSGVRHFLSGTPFKVIYESVGAVSGLDHEVAQEPALFVLATYDFSNEILKTAQQIKERYRATQVALLVNHLDFTLATEAYAAGVDGFCLINSSRDVLITSLEMVALGQSVLPGPLLSSLLSGEALNREPHPATTISRKQKAPDPLVAQLSAREMEILNCLQQGQSNRQLARKFHIAESTMKANISAILRKIRAKNRTQAAEWAAKHLSMTG